MGQIRPIFETQTLKNATQYIYGRNAVAEALLAKRVLEAYVSSGFSDRQLLLELENNHVPITRKETEWLTTTAKGNHQGIVALVRGYGYASLELMIETDANKDFPLLIVLDSIVDPHNFGAIIRNGEAFGATGVIIRKDRAVGLTSSVVKVASGAIEHMMIAQVVNLSQTLSKLQQQGYWIVASALEGAIDYRDFDYKRKIALVIGSEGTGISPLLRKHSDVVVKIPMIGRVNSINASAACAVLLAHIQSMRFPR
ncbi:MAG TPA: 23S rRNA (guanosine(2251)-2'-O)-methyltransferase RlmB [Bacilli bacterium]|jgi:23S rRNA (guanosine2251-2'-O)-methyltransferase|nr:23S rRNA (guanosine(2251)-2'-O)-methyltransferase RlmB [Bacilli bacterium]